MINANFTETIGCVSVAGKTLPVYEVRVEKGCGKKSEFMKNVKKGNLCKITLYNQGFMSFPIFGVLLFIPCTCVLGYRILDEIEFCDSKQPSICESKK